MTTILYKNGILAADNRISRAAPPGGHCCLACGESARTGKNGTSKIVRGGPSHEKARFRGERLLAAAGAGPTGWCRVMRKMLVAGDDIELFNKNLVEATNNNGDETTAKESARPVNGAFIIVTEKQVCIYTAYAPEDKRVLTFPLDTQEVLTVGSGGPFAYAAAVVGQLNAQDSVGVAGQCDMSTGLAIDYIDCLAEKLEVQHEDYTGRVKTRYSPRG